MGWYSYLELITLAVLMLMVLFFCNFDGACVAVVVSILACVLHFASWDFGSSTIQMVEWVNDVVMPCRSSACYPPNTTANTLLKCRLVKFMFAVAGALIGCILTHTLIALSVYHILHGPPMHATRE